MLTKRIKTVCTLLLAVMMLCAVPFGTPALAEEGTAASLWETVGPALPTTSGEAGFAVDKSGNVYAAGLVLQSGKTDAWDAAIQRTEKDKWVQLALLHSDDASVAEAAIAICNGELYAAWADSTGVLHGGILEDDGVKELWKSTAENPASLQFTVSGTKLYLTYTTAAKAGEKPSAIHVLNGLDGKAAAADVTGTGLTGGALCQLGDTLYMLYGAADGSSTIAAYDSTKNAWAGVYTLALKNAALYSLTASEDTLYAAAATGDAAQPVLVTYDGKNFTETAIDGATGLSLLQLQEADGTLYLTACEKATGRTFVLAQGSDGTFAAYDADLAATSGGVAGAFFKDNYLYAAVRSSDGKTVQVSCLQTAPAGPDESTIEHTLSVTPPEGYTSTTLYIDGIAYAGTAAGDALQATVVGNTAQSIVMYKYDEENVPIGMYVWALGYANGEYTVTAVPELEDLLSYHGFSIRLDGTLGIRFKTGISTTTRAALQNGLAGYKLVEYGTLVMNSESMEAGKAFVKGLSYVGSGRAYWYTGSTLHDAVFETKDGRYRYTSVMVGMPTTAYPVNYAFRGYIILQKDGKEITLYGPAVSRSISYVARQIVASGAYAATHKATTVSIGILSAVEEDGWVGNYYFVNGKLSTGPTEITDDDGNKATYMFSENGVLQKGDVTYDGKAYYADLVTGVLQTNFTLNRGSAGLTYFDENGVSAAGWLTVEAGKYYQDKTASGIFTLAGGFKKIDSATYYFDPVTHLLLLPEKEGEVEIGGVKYYMYTDGHIASDPTLSGVNVSYNDGTYTLTVTADFAPVGTHSAGSYSFDGGKTWQTSNVKAIAAVSGGSLPAGSIVVRNAFGLTATYNQAISIATKGNKGIDVSAHQGTVNWTQVKASGVDFVIIRALTWSRSVNYYVIDPYFEQNVRNAKAAGLQVGVYLYSYAFKLDEMAEEINFFHNSAEMARLRQSGIKFDFPVYIDYEDPLLITYAGSKDNRTNTIRYGMQLLKQYGYYPGFYTYESFANNYIDANALINEGYDFWLANFNGTHGFTDKIGIWQYSSTGTVNGISTSVDLNISYKDYPSIINPTGNTTTVTPMAEQLTVYDQNTGKVVTGNAEDILAQIAANEVGGASGILTGNDLLTVYKAQAVAAHSWIQYQYLNNNAAPAVGLAPTKVTDTIRSAVSAVKNQIVTYNGSVACTVYGSASADPTNTAADMGWGNLPYLTNVSSPYDATYAAKYQAKSTVIPASRMKAAIEALLGAGATDGVPYSQWVTNIQRNSYGYITSVSLCGKTVNGGAFFENCYGLYSPYAQLTAVDATNGTWTFLTNGNGHCVGMSQYGAMGYAAVGTSWQDILLHYYPGCAITTQN